MSELPFVRRGQPITAELWNRLVAAVRAVRLLPGDGARLRSTPHGTMVGFEASPAPWAHPFQVSLIGQTAALIRPGFVNAIEPKIDGVPLSGSDDEPPPRLEFRRLRLDNEKRGYIAIDITCGEKWEVLKDKLTIVQVAYFDSENGKDPPPGSGGPSSIGGIPGLPGRRVRYPIAVLRQRSSGRLDVFQIVFFNIDHRAQPRNDQLDVARHFFWPGAA